MTSVVMMIPHGPGSTTSNSQLLNGSNHHQNRVGSSMRTNSKYNTTRNHLPSHHHGIPWYWISLASAMPAFFLGNLTCLMMGLDRCSNCPAAALSTNNDGEGESHFPPRQYDSNSAASAAIDARIRQAVRQAAAVWQNDLDVTIEKQIQERLKQQPIQGVGAGMGSNECPVSSTFNFTDLFPQERVGRFVAGMARIDKLDFTNTLDMGVPLDAPGVGSSDVVIIYGKTTALPQVMQEISTSKDDADDEDDAASSGHASIHPIIPNLTMAEATENCAFLNILLTDFSSGRDQCIAVVPQYESYHLQKWMRMSTEEGGSTPQQRKQRQLAMKRRKFSAMAKSAPFQMVSRGQQSNGRDQFAPPAMTDTNKHWDLLRNFLENVDVVKAELQEILSKIAIDNTVIVMVCNFGQSELLMNFACAGRSRGLDMSNILVFTTDQETTDLATSLGLNAYFDQRNFGDIPTEAARRYGDRKFVAMMMAKVICVQLVSMLGYDFLFQDVDIVWYRNPLEYFQQHKQVMNEEKNKYSLTVNYDILFQDDGGHSLRYAPYSANSGFYFVRHNDKTRHFLTSLLMAGDLVLKTDSHQQAMIALLNEHVSLYGLRVKVLSREEEEFPGGYQFHQRSGLYMRSLFAGNTHPYIFHMSWTLNKDNKLLFFRQMGQWYVQDTCVAKKREEITGGSSDQVDLRATCCSAEPLISCHYRDKPSIIPCRDSPPIDKGKKSWW